MAFIGGDIRDIIIKNSALTQGQISLFPKAGEDNTINLGGVTSGDDTAMITSAGQAIWSMSNQRWQFSVTVAWDNLVNKELHELQKESGSTTESEFVVTFMSGASYSLTGKIVGEIQGSIQNATISITAQGSSNSVKQLS